MASLQFDSFQKTLKKVFMLDQAELDFGIYRIMNQKKADIENYLNKNLKAQVTEILEKNKSSKLTDLENELKEAQKSAEKIGVSPNDVPRVQELKAELAALGDTTALENEVYSHLTVFFSRYYDGGDFISQRRYKKDVYAIPYEGEEVKLYWANADQYYIKTGEYFRNYRFKLDSGKYVEFTLKDVNTELNNNKAQNNMERRFAMYQDCPVEVINDELHLNFTYELYPKATKQKALIDEAYEAVKDLIPSDFKADLFALRPTETDKARTLLRKHLTDYVARNTFDYFIHKDLKGFLSRELDFYIKNEILEIDDIDARTTESFLAHLTVIKAIKNVGGKIIEFLSSLENFQKRLWLKKKMVVSADYCITLDRVPEKLYAEICANESQREEWVKLFAINEIKTSTASGIFSQGSVAGYSVPLTEQFLKENPFLVLDTALFPEDFKRRLISEIDSLDEQCDGLLINSENFQALNLMQEKYRRNIKCIYIDPPYNTTDASLLYKNSYKHSSWIAMIHNRISISKNLINNEGALLTTIDDEELYNLKQVLDSIFSRDGYFGTIVIESNPRGRSVNSHYATCHEYCLCYAQNIDGVTIVNDELTDEQAAVFSGSDDENQYRLLPFRRSGGWSEPVDRPNSEFPLYFVDNVLIAVGDERESSAIEEYKSSNVLMLREGRVIKIDLELFKKEFPNVIKVMPIDSSNKRRVWRWSDREKILKAGDKRQFILKNNGSYYVQLKDYIKDGRKPKTIWIGPKFDSSSYGTNVLRSLFGERSVFGFPKSLFSTYQSLHTIVGDTEFSDSIILDYFGGSGTTAHAVINLNREEGAGGKRKYILVEMGSYFDTVTKPRVQKAIYSEDWKDGKPISRKGISHCFKYIRLEQYEDTLNNLVVKNNTWMEQEGEFFDGYMLGYLLDTETKDSLFSLQWFTNPWNIKLKITRNNETKEERIDLIETFNFLIGLNVQRMAYPKTDICVVEGYNRKNEHILVIWRDCTKVSNTDLNDFFKKMDYSTRDREFDRIYVNGDNNLENLKTDADTWKVTLIEQEFSKKMFEEA